MKKVAVVPYDAYAEFHRVVTADPKLALGNLKPAIERIVDQVEIINDPRNAEAVESMSIALPGSPSDAPFLAIKALAELMGKIIDKVPQFAVDDAAKQWIEMWKPVHEMHCAAVKALSEGLRR